MANQHITGNLQVDGVVQLSNTVQLENQSSTGYLCVKGLAGTTGIRLKEYNGATYADIKYDGTKIILDKNVQISSSYMLTASTVTITGALYIN